jgi:hypothetical protein
MNSWQPKFQDAQVITKNPSKSVAMCGILYIEEHSLLHCDAV